MWKCNWRPCFALIQFDLKLWDLKFKRWLYLLFLLFSEALYYYLLSIELFIFFSFPVLSTCHKIVHLYYLGINLVVLSNFHQFTKFSDLFRSLLQRVSIFLHSYNVFFYRLAIHIILNLKSWNIYEGDLENFFAHKNQPLPPSFSENGELRPAKTKSGITDCISRTEHASFCKISLTAHAQSTYSRQHTVKHLLNMPTTFSCHM